MSTATHLNPTPETATAADVRATIASAGDRIRDLTPLWAGHIYGPGLVSEVGSALVIATDGARAVCEAMPGAVAGNVTPITDRAERLRMIGDGSALELATIDSAADTAAGVAAAATHAADVLDLFAEHYTSADPYRLEMAAFMIRGAAVGLARWIDRAADLERALGYVVARDTVAAPLKAMRTLARALGEAAEYGAAFGQTDTDKRAGVADGVAAALAATPNRSEFAAMVANTYRLAPALAVIGDGIPAPLVTVARAAWRAERDRFAAHGLSESTAKAADMVCTDLDRSTARAREWAFETVRGQMESAAHDAVRKAFPGWVARNAHRWAADSAVRAKNNDHADALLATRSVFYTARKGGQSARSGGYVNATFCSDIETGSLPAAYIDLLNADYKAARSLGRPFYATWSYDTPIAWTAYDTAAWRRAGARGITRGAMVAPDVSYSVTTSNHQAGAGKRVKIDAVPTDIIRKGAGRSPFGPRLGSW